MKEINRDTLKALRGKIDAALAPLAAELGIKIHAGNCTFTPGSATFKLEVATIGENGQVRDPRSEKYAMEYKALHRLYGLPADGLGKAVNFNGKTFIITGLNQRCERFPLTAKRDGRDWKLPLAALGGQIDYGTEVKPLSPAS